MLKVSQYDVPKVESKADIYQELQKFWKCKISSSQVSNLCFCIAHIRSDQWKQWCWTQGFTVLTCGNRPSALCAALLRLSWLYKGETPSDAEQHALECFLIKDKSWKYHQGHMLTHYSYSSHLENTNQFNTYILYTHTCINNNLDALWTTRLEIVYVHKIYKLY